MVEKLLPQSIEAEQGVLGSIIIDPEALVQVADFLHAEDFYRDAHRAIYSAIVHLESADCITLCDELERREKLEDVGGADYIISLINQVPTSGNVEYYGRIVERKAQHRRLIHAAGMIAANAYQEEDDALEKAEEAIYRIAQKKGTHEILSLADLASSYMDDLDFLHEHRGGLIGVPTGFTLLDRMLGGLQKTDLITLAARPAMGKSSLALNIAMNAARKGHPVAVFSLEMGKKQLMARLLSQLMGIDLGELRTGRWDSEEWNKITDGMGKLSELPIYIDDTGGLSPTQLRSKVMRLKAEYGIELVIVDYIGLMEVSINGKQYENKVQEVSKITKSLKSLALELNLPILALSQLSRDVEKRGNKRPLLSDLRDSGSIEQDSDVVLFIYRDDVYKQEGELDGLAELIVAKHRNGPIGEISLRWDGHYTRFSNLEVVHAQNS